MRLFLFFLVLAVLSGCDKPSSGLSAAPASAAPAAGRAAQTQAAQEGMSLAGFIDAWSLRQAGTGKHAEQESPPDAEQQMQDRIARFRAAHPRKHSDTDSAAARSAARPGDLAGLRAGDKAALPTTTAPLQAAAAIDPAVQALRQEQMAERIQQFRAARQLQLAQSGMDTNLPAAARPGPHP
ncbi:hypothetical protein ACI48D_09610 [Massilia sp. LXY-6]|uniref:hypothetical protein n=1 Tax=Massilia sp. LXY-6 TaxID=3379823 RepID=UPI003EE21555